MMGKPKRKTKLNRSTNQVLPFISLANETNRKTRSKRYNHRRLEGNNSTSDTNRDTLTSAPIENVSSDEEMVDIETTEEHSLAAHPTQRCIR